MKRFVLFCLFPVFVSASDLDPTGMTQVLSGIDDKATSIQMGHTFPWLDQVFTHAWMSTNGFVLMYNPTTGIGRQTAPPSGYCCDGYTHGTGMPTYMPNTYGLSNFSYMIAPMWTDLDDTSSAADAGYFYKTDSESTSFLWHKVREYATTNENTFGLTLDKTGGFKFQYEDVNVSLHHKAFVGWYGGNFPTGDGSGSPWTQEWEMNGFTTNDVQNYGGDTTFDLTNGVASLIMSASTLVDCTNPLNDSTCDGYWDAVAESSVTDEYTDAVFGDEVEDFFFVDRPERQGQPQPQRIPDPPAYEPQEEREMFGLNVIPEEGPRGDEPRPDTPQRQPEPEIYEEPERLGEPEQFDRPVERIEEPVEIPEEPVEAVREPRPEPRPERAIVLQEPVEREEPVEVERRERQERAEIIKEPEPEREREEIMEREAIRPAVDVVGIALSLTGQQTSRSNQVSVIQQRVQSEEQEQQLFQENAAIYGMGSLRSQSVTKTITQQAQQEENTITTSDLAPPAQMQFEDDFNDAIATGQSVGQFLSAQLPDFSRFEVAPPSQDEQRTVQRAESSIQTMSQADVQQSLDDQLENIGDTGGFTDQSLAVFLISNNPAFSQYQDVNLSDRDEFYESTQVYPQNTPRADPLGVLRLGGSDTFNELVDIQWQR
jgi:hypothetical protein